MAREREVVVESYQLTKVFRDFWRRVKARALDRVDLQVYRGEVFGLLGPNGSGKSTFIKIALGLLFPTRGKVAVFGRHPRNVGVKERIGFMPEESYLYRYLNAEEVLDFYGRLFRLNGTERRRRIGALLDMVGLTAQRTRPLSEYSKGMARRIGLAQALINDPDLLVLDEPTTGLDPLGTREIKDLIVEMKRRGKTVLLCSHLLADVEDVCDRIAILYGGKVRRMGSVKGLLQRQAVTQITAGELSPETVAALLDVIEQNEGDKQVSVETPMDKLENFFLRVVEEARAARLTTGGATAGGGFEKFFDAADAKKPRDVLSELLIGGEAEEAAADPAEAEAEEEAPAVPAASRREQPDRDLLADLSEDHVPEPVEEPEEGEVPAAESEPVVLPASDRRREVEEAKRLLESLVTPESGEGQEDAEESEDDKA